MPPQNSEQARWFAQEVQPHESLLRAWLQTRFGARLEVDDLVQEAYMRVLRGYGSAEMASPKAFLFATARNLALDRLRRHDVSRTDLHAEIDELEILDGAAGVPEIVARNQELALLAEAIQSLPARCRQIFTLRKLYGLSHREIAGRLGISESTVSNQLIIGIEKCTDFFAEHGDRNGGAT